TQESWRAECLLQQGENFSLRDFRWGILPSVGYCSFLVPKGIQRGAGRFSGLLLAGDFSL
ncbi:MAG: hypothetical protein N2509_06600, partial [Treponemataceae bacterium]|nr:hypothetical protein [Treponemataceae bacterium]